MVRHSYCSGVLYYKCPTSVIMVTGGRTSRKICIEFESYNFTNLNLMISPIDIVKNITDDMVVSHITTNNDFLTYL